MLQSHIHFCCSCCWVWDKKVISCMVTMIGYSHCCCMYDLSDCWFAGDMIDERYWIVWTRWNYLQQDWYLLCWGLGRKPWPVTQTDCNKTREQSKTQIIHWYHYYWQNNIHISILALNVFVNEWEYNLFVMYQYQPKRMLLHPFVMNQQFMDLLPRTASQPFAFGTQN